MKASSWCVLVAIVSVSVAAFAAPAQRAPDALVPGVKLTITSGKLTDARPARLIAISVPENTAPTPFLPKGPFTATFEGFVNLRIRGEYTFHPVGNGSVKIFINDKPAMTASGADLSATKTEPVKLLKGKNKIRVEYASPASGDALFRLYWVERGPAEPVGPMVLTHDASDAELAAKWKVHQGRELFGELRCIRCHTANEVKADSGMPELSQDAPDLSQTAFRLNQQWIAAWIANPRQFNPRAEMPRMFASADGSTIGQEAADIASYLVEVKGAVPSIPPPPPADDAEIASGARLYASLGCIACHTPPDFAGEDSVSPPRIPHKYIRAKYNLGALMGFLKKPEEHFKWIRMPNFRLTDEEARALAQYLYYKSPEVEFKVPTGDPARGKKLFAESGCLNCHAAEGNQNIAKFASLVEITKDRGAAGCVAGDAAHRKGAPDFALDEEERGQVEAFLATDLKSLDQDAAPEFAERQIKLLNCAACHPRDKEDDAWSGLSKEVDAFMSKLPPEGQSSEQYAPDQSRPPLTWIGEKLRPEWMAQFIAGKVGYKPRPWIRARMPGFAARATGIAEGLAREHGFAATSAAPGKPNAALAETGQKLTSKAGFSCVQCHAVADQKALAAFEAPAPNFSHVAERLRHEYYQRWMMKPQRVMPGTRMPDFADAEGKTALKDYFNGDANKQFDAIWNYLLEGDSIQPPP